MTTGGIIALAIGCFFAGAVVGAFLIALLAANGRD